MMNIAVSKDKKIFETLGSYFFNLSESSDDVYWVRSADLRQFVYINPKSLTLFGISAELLCQDAALWHNAILAEDRDKIRQVFMECVARGLNRSSFKFAYRVALPSGKITTISELGTPIYAGKKCLGYAGYSRDISAAKLPEKSMELVYFAKSFTKALDSVFWVRDKSCEKQLYISPAVKQIFGLEAKELYDQPSLWKEHIISEDRETFLFDDLTHHEKRFRIKRRDGEVRWIKDTNFPLYNESNELLGYGGIAEDITDAVQRENELLLAKNNAEDANRTKSDFLAMMSHELRTPLNAILGMSQILKSSEITDYQRDQVDVIAQSGQNLLSLLNDILDFAKLEVGKLSFSNEEFDLLSLLEMIAIDMAASAKEKQLEFTLEVHDGLPRYVKGDPKRLRQVLVNLISNAIKYTKVGSVNLKARCLQTNSNMATFSFTVNDTGIGIPSEKLDSIFQRFQQVDSVYRRKHEGVGLGLAIVKELVERMGGSITVNSKESEGSCFICLLPMNFKMKNHIAKEPAALYEPSKQQFTQFDARVLIVEDNAINQKIAAALLEQLGCIVDVVDNGEAALRKYKDGYDLVFLDIGLPDLDGFTVGEKMREEETEGERTPIIALTAHVFAQDRKRCFDVGMDEVMAKPVMREDLIAVLSRWTRKRQ